MDNALRVGSLFCSTFSENDTLLGIPEGPLIPKVPSADIVATYQIFEPQKYTLRCYSNPLGMRAKKRAAHVQLELQEETKRKADASSLALQPYSLGCFSWVLVKEFTFELS